MTWEKSDYYGIMTVATFLGLTISSCLLLEYGFNCPDGLMVGTMILFVCFMSFIFGLGWHCGKETELERLSKK